MYICGLFISCDFCCHAGCREKCGTCKIGKPTDGGTPLGVDGNCQHWCSPTGDCGDGEDYKHFNGVDGTDCRTCKIGIVGIYLSKSLFFHITFICLYVKKYFCKISYRLR